MAGFKPQVNDMIQVRVCCYSSTQIALNILHYRVVALVNTGLDLQQIATFLSLRFSNIYKAVMSNQTKYRGVGVSNLSPPRTVEYVDVANDGPGLGTLGTAPTQTSYLLRLRGNLAGRKGVGHVYPGFVRSDYVTVAGNLTALGLADLRTIAEDIGPELTCQQGNDSTLLALNIRNADVNVPLPQTPQGTPVYTIYPSPIFATQRRRGSFGANNLPPF